MSARLPTLLAAALLATAGCRSREPVQVGLVVGLSGRHYDLGVSGRDGATLAAEEINAAGGVGGRRLDLVVRDDEQKPEVARRLVEELARSPAVAIIGPMTSAMAEVMVPVADREQILLVSPTVSASQFMGHDDWMVMLNQSSARSVKALAARMLATGQGKRLAVIHDQSNAAFSRAWLDGIRAELEGGGGRVAAAVPFTSGEVASYAELAGAALAASPDGVLVVANALDSATICQQLRKRSTTIPIYGSDWGFTKDVLVHGGSSVEGAIFTLKVNLDDHTPAFDRFRAAFVRRFNRSPDFAAVLAYEATQLVADGVRRDGSRSGLRRAILATGNYPGLLGDFLVDSSGDVVRPQLLMTVRNGQFVRLE